MLQRLLQVIRYEFRDPRLLDLALSHRSVGKDNNERLEFLGDSLVNCIIAQALFDKDLDATEGDLSRMRASLVKGDTLAEIAREFQLGEYLKLGLGEIKSGGHQRASILAGALEALIGAIYLDSDFEVCKIIVLKWFADRLQRTATETIVKDPKTQLQEYLQSIKVDIPEYKLLSIVGAAHTQVFSVECVVKGLDKSMIAEGLSRRKAEQQAAQIMLQELTRDQ